MARTSDTADYMVTQCQACGMLNVIPREYSDGRVCGLFRRAIGADGIRNTAGETNEQNHGAGRCGA